jgi:hypothetical protein
MRMWLDIGSDRVKTEPKGAASLAVEPVLNVNTITNCAPRVLTKGRRPDIKIQQRILC